MNILTFDIEEWFHILDNDSTKLEDSWSSYENRLESNMDRIFKLLDKKNQKATFFVLGWVAKKHPHIVKKIHDLGYEIASHSDSHQLAYEQSRKEFSTDLEFSIKRIEDLIGVKVNIYRAPGFSIKEENKWAFEELVNQGIEIDCSIFPIKRSHGGFKSFGTGKPTIINYEGYSLKELPMNYGSLLGINFVFSGGGYFRLFPYKFIKKLMFNSDYVMTYFHPRDFDAEQPIIKDLSLTRKFKSYYGLNNTYSKLENIIDDFNFVDIASANNLINWNCVDHIKI